MVMRVLLARSHEENSRAAAILRAHGHDVMSAPLLDIRLYEGPPLDLDSVQGILLTSANGARALAARALRRDVPVAARALRRDVPVFAVGLHTAEVATAAGFSDVRHAAGDSAALAQAVCRWTTPSKGSLLRIAGRERSDMLVEVLRKGGFRVGVEELYAAEPLRLTDAVAAAIRAGQIEAVMLFSPRSAALFMDEALRLNLQHKLATVVAVCISDATAGQLSSISFARVEVAKSPNLEGMLALLDVP